MLEPSISELGDALGSSLETYREGKINLIAPVAKKVVSTSDVVFYNPRMAFSRDVSICILRAYQKLNVVEMDLCEPLTGCGVRAVRWACELPGIRTIVAADVNPKASLLASVNASLNKVSDKIEIFKADANTLLDDFSYCGRRFDAIDIDPFGAPVYFVDPALRAIKREGGLLCLTATDMQPLCGIHQSACLRKYGGMSLRTEYCHEIAVRLMIGAAVRMASRLDIGAKPVFCHSSDHYVRAYISTKKSALDADKNLDEIGYILHCFKCGNRRIANTLLVPLEGSKCEYCGSTMRIAGPLWRGSLWDPEVVRSARAVVDEIGCKSNGRLAKMLDLVLSEIDGPPTYYDLHSLCDSEGVNSPATSRVVECLRNEGFFASLTHFKGTGVRTTANIQTVRSLLRDLRQKKQG